MFTTPFAFMAQVSAGSQLFLDDYPGAVRAYSYRKLRTDYGGSAVRVRRSSDNTELDIGFVGENLDTTALTTFVGGGTGFVRTWYDQSVSASNANQTNSGTQPVIVSAGSIVTQNELPSPLYNSNPFLDFDGTALAQTKYSIFGVVSRTDSGGSIYYIGGNEAGINQLLHIGFRNDTTFTLAQYANDLDAAIPAFTVPILQAWSTFNVATGKSIYLNNVQLSSNANTTDLVSFNQAHIGKYAFGSIYKGHISELIFYADDQVPNVSGINANINAYYSLF